MEPGPPALGLCSLNPWTIMEVPLQKTFLFVVPTFNISWVEAWDASENPTMPRTAPSPPLQGAPGVHPHRQRCAEKPWAKYHNYCTTVNSEYQGRLLLLLNPLSHLLHEELMDNLRHPDSAMGRDTSVLHTSCRGSPLDVFCLCFSFFLFLLL